MKALYVQSHATRNEEVVRIAHALPDPEDPDVRIFSEDSDVMAFPNGTVRAANYLFPNPPKTFQQILLSDQIRLFRNPWAKVFLKRMTDALAPDGRILLPFHPDRRARTKGYWSLSALQQLFRQTGEVSKRGNCVEFHRSELSFQEGSILSWYFDEHEKLVAEDLALRKQSDPESQADAVRRHIYYVRGISYKSAIMAHIIREYLSGRSELRLIDHGGGYGLLAADLLLHRELNLAIAVNCDINPYNLVFARRLLSYFSQELSDRFLARRSAAEDFEYDEPYDIVSFINVLLYVPRDRTRDTLDRAWKALRPGGLLVLWENYKSPAFKTRGVDYDKMFSDEELDGLLASYGNVRYFLSTATQSIPQWKARRKTVFRVAEKSA